MVALLALLFIFLWVPVASMMSGAVLETFWYWFIVPLGAPDITVAHAMGIALIVHFLTFKHPNDDDDDRKVVEIVLRAVFMHLFMLGMFLLFGYIIKSYM